MAKVEELTVCLYKKRTRRSVFLYNINDVGGYALPAFF